MKKITLILIVFIMCTSCGYNPMYSNKNFNFNITKIEKFKEDRLNLVFERIINNFSNDQAINQISLETNAEKQIIVVSKNAQGDPSRYQMIIKLELVIIDDKKNKKIKKNIVQKFSYNTNSNRFKLNQYEKEIEEILINKIVDETIKHISKF
tara:strand:+ start:34 stop:489 length:456 start_codon:yes stop_codon:yes gene_type:complete